jgi:type III pantothenate kinase
MSDSIIAADVGNSRIKLGLFANMDFRDRRQVPQAQSMASQLLPEPVQTLDLPLADKLGAFDEQRLRDWCHVAPPSADWLVASVHRAAAQRLRRLVSERAGSVGPFRLRELTYSELPIDVRVPQPHRVGIDRVAAAAAANQLRAAGRAAVVVDHGTAITVDVVSPAGEFIGGAILPGMAMAAQALAEHTDALPLVAVEGLQPGIPLVGDATVPAIEAGLFWGTYGAVRELVTQIVGQQERAADVYMTGGGAASFSERLASDTGLHIQHVPHLVLAGIALACSRRGGTPASGV